jgi:hypothetical protein
MVDTTKNLTAPNMLSESAPADLPTSNALWYSDDPNRFSADALPKI